MRNPRNPTTRSRTALSAGHSAEPCGSRHPQTDRRAAIAAGHLPGSIPSLHSLPGLSSRYRGAIVNGSASVGGSDPWLAFVSYTANGGSSACTGAVVSPVVVLTAAHCAMDAQAGTVNQPQGYVVVTGALDWSDPTAQRAGVGRVIVNPSYNAVTGQNDAALLVLDAPTTAPVIPLATTADAALADPGSVIEAAGWGETIGGEISSAPTSLQDTSTVVQAPTYCARNYPQFDPNTQLCTIDAPYYDSGTCFGDSGGPLIANDLVGQSGDPTEIGIASRVIGSCSTTRPDLYTRADAISTWANAWIAAQPVSTPPARSGQSPSPSKPSLPRMALTEAKSYIKQTLAAVFRTRFSRGSYTVDCSRVSGVQFACTPNWSHKGLDFYGTVSVYYETQQENVVWTDRCSIDWVSDRCYFHSGHPRRCRVYRARGTY